VRSIRQVTSKGWAAERRGLILDIPRAILVEDHDELVTREDP
jgi:hypothetical protein